MHVYRSTYPHPSASTPKTSIHYLHLRHLHIQIYIHTYLSYIFDYVHVNICTIVTPASVSLPFPIRSRAAGMLCFPAKDLPFGPVGASDAGFPGVYRMLRQAVSLTEQLRLPPGYSGPSSTCWPTFSAVYSRLLQVLCAASPTCLLFQEPWAPASRNDTQ